MEEIEKIDITNCSVEDRRKVLAGYEAKLSDAKAQPRFAQGSLNREDSAAGRLILSLEAQIAESRKRLDMAMNQAATAEAKRASADAGAPHDRVFEVTTPNGRVVRHRHESAGALQKVLMPGYRVVAEVFGAGIDDKGGMIEPVGQSTMKSLLAAHGDELVAFLAERGIIGSSAIRS